MAIDVNYVMERLSAIPSHQQEESQVRLIFETQSFIVYREHTKW